MMHVIILWSIIVEIEYLTIIINLGSLAFTHAHYGRGSGPIHLDNVHCTGREQRLIDCTYTNNTSGLDCTHSEDASVACRRSNSISW